MNRREISSEIFVSPKGSPSKRHLIHQSKAWKVRPGSNGLSLPFDYSENDTVQDRRKQRLRAEKQKALLENLEAQRRRQQKRELAELNNTKIQQALAERKEFSQKGKNELASKKRECDDKKRKKRFKKIIRRKIIKRVLRKPIDLPSKTEDEYEYEEEEILEDEDVLEEEEILEEVEEVKEHHSEKDLNGEDDEEVWKDKSQEIEVWENDSDTEEEEEFYEDESEEEAMLEKSYEQGEEENLENDAEEEEEEVRESDSYEQGDEMWESDFNEGEEELLEDNAAFRKCEYFNVEERLHRSEEEVALSEDSASDLFEVLPINQDIDEDVTDDDDMVEEVLSDEGDEEVFFAQIRGNKEDDEDDEDQDSLTASEQFRQEEDEFAREQEELFRLAAERQAEEEEDFRWEEEQLALEEEARRLAEREVKLVFSPEDVAKSERKETLLDMLQSRPQLRPTKRVKRPGEESVLDRPIGYRPPSLLALVNQAKIELRPPPPEKHKEEFVPIVLDAASIGRLVRLNEVVIEAQGQRNVQEFNTKATDRSYSTWEANHSQRGEKRKPVTRKTRSTVQIMVNEAAALGKLRTRREVDAHMGTLSTHGEEIDIDDLGDDKYDGAKVIRTEHLIDRMVGANRRLKTSDWTPEYGDEEYDDLNDVILPTVEQPRFKPQKTNKSQQKMREELSQAVAEGYWGRYYRLERPGATLNVTQGCFCKYCNSANAWQTYAYQKKWAEERLPPSDELDKDADPTQFGYLSRLYLPQESPDEIEFIALKDMDDTRNIELGSVDGTCSVDFSFGSLDLIDESDENSSTHDSFAGNDDEDEVALQGSNIDTNSVDVIPFYSDAQTLHREARAQEADISSRQSSGGASHEAGTNHFDQIDLKSSSPDDYIPDIEIRDANANFSGTHLSPTQESGDVVSLSPNSTVLESQMRSSTNFIGSKKPTRFRPLKWMKKTFGQSTRAPSNYSMNDEGANNIVPADDLVTKDQSTNITESFRQESHPRAIDGKDIDDPKGSENDEAGIQTYRADELGSEINMAFASSATSSAKESNSVQTYPLEVVSNEKMQVEKNVHKEDNIIFSLSREAKSCDIAAELTSPPGAISEGGQSDSTDIATADESVALNQLNAIQRILETDVDVKSSSDPSEASASETQISSTPAVSPFLQNHASLPVATLPIANVTFKPKKRKTNGILSNLMGGKESTIISPTSKNCKDSSRHLDEESNRLLDTSKDENISSIAPPSPENESALTNQSPLALPRTNNESQSTLCVSHSPSCNTILPCKDDVIDESGHAELDVQDSASVVDRNLNKKGTASHTLPDAEFVSADNRPPLSTEKAGTPSESRAVDRTTANKAIYVHSPTDNCSLGHDPDPELTNAEMDGQEIGHETIQTVHLNTDKDGKASNALADAQSLMKRHPNLTLSAKGVASSESQPAVGTTTSQREPEIRPDARSNATVSSTLNLFEKGASDKTRNLPLPTLNSSNRIVASGEQIVNPKEADIMLDSSESSAIESTFSRDIVMPHAVFAVSDRFHGASNPKPTSAKARLGILTQLRAEKQAIDNANAHKSSKIESTPYMKNESVGTKRLSFKLETAETIDVKPTSLSGLHKSDETLISSRTKSLMQAISPKSTTTRNTNPALDRPTVKAMASRIQRNTGLVSSKAAKTTVGHDSTGSSGTNLQSTKGPFETEYADHESASQKGSVERKNDCSSEIHSERLTGRSTKKYAVLLPENKYLSDLSSSQGLFDSKPDLMRESTTYSNRSMLGKKASPDKDMSTTNQTTEISPKWTNMPMNPTTTKTSLSTATANHTDAVTHPAKVMKTLADSSCTSFRKKASLENKAYTAHALTQSDPSKLSTSELECAHDQRVKSTRLTSSALSLAPPVEHKVTVHQGRSSTRPVARTGSLVPLTRAYFEKNNNSNDAGVPPWGILDFGDVKSKTAKKGSSSNTILATPSIEKSATPQEQETEEVARAGLVSSFLMARK